MYAIFWLGAFGVLLLIEILTLGLTTIWFGRRGIGRIFINAGACLPGDTDDCIFYRFSGNADIYPPDNDKVSE